MTRTLDDLLADLRQVCTCIGENKAQEGDELCLFCDSRLQIEAQQRTIGLLQARLKPAPADPTPRDVAQILCDNSPRCDDGGCTHTSSEVSK